MRTDGHGRGRSRGRAARWLVALGAVVLSGAIYLSGALNPLERALTDTRFRLLERTASGTLVIVEIDPRSLTALDSWPWPRGYHAEVIDRLVDAGASTIAFDVDLGSRSSESGDELLAAALGRSAGRVILPVFRQLDNSDGVNLRIVHNGPHPMFRRLVRIASVNTTPAADGLIRQHAATHFWQDGMIPSMAALLAPVRPIFDVFDIDFGIRPGTLPRVSYVDVLQGNFDPAKFDGRAVLVGATAVELGDQFAVPVYKALPGPIMQGLAYESIIQGRTLKRSSALLALGLMSLIVLLSAGWFIRRSWRRGLVLLGAVTAGLVVSSIALQAWTPMQLDITPSIFAALLLYAGALTNRVEHLDLKLLVRRLRIHRKSTLMRNVVERSTEGIVTVTVDHLVDFANPAAGTIFGLDPADMRGRSLEILLVEGDDEPLAVDALIGDSAERPRSATGRRANGESFPIEFTSNEMTIDGEMQYVVLLRDVTEQRAQQELLEYLALHDTLTGLPNRALLMDRVDQAIARARRENTQLALLLLDLDRFKQINDTLGHAMGDALLAEIGQALGAPLRRSDTIARLGGDEFAILLPSVNNVAQARDVAERVASELARPFVLGDMTVDVGVSVGIAMYPDHGTDGSQLMRSADVAMYVAKRERTTVSLYASAKDDNSLRSLAMVTELRTALDEGELTVFYQPMIDLESDHLVGAEALVRWNHPAHGLMPPSEFVPLAEQINLVRPLTRWMLGQAVRQIATWNEKGFDLGVSVNLSTRNLQEEDLAECLQDLLLRNDVPASRLTLEITEDAIMENPDVALAAIRQLNDIGVRLAIDDFGTGYSSLAYLKALPVDQLKIDKSFVTGMTEDESDAVIVRSTVDLAHNLGLKVVGEGVESADHVARLKELGCDVGQGYYFGKPLPLEKFDALVEQKAVKAGPKVVELNPAHGRRKHLPDTA